MRLILVFIILFQVCNAQMSFSEVDKLTYDALVAGNYETLIKIGEKAIEEGHEFMYLNYRLGIAYFKNGDFLKAEKHLVKVYQQNPSEEGITYYLSQTYIALGQKGMANIYQPKTFNYAAIQLGVKSFNTPSLGENMFLKTLELGLSTTKNHQITLNYANINQNVYWGNYNQNQVFFGNKWTISKSLSFNANFHYIQLKGNTSSTWKDPENINETTVSAPEGILQVESVTNNEYYTSGQISQSNYLINIGSNFKTGKTIWGIGFNALMDDNNDIITQNQTSTGSITSKNELGEIVQDFTNTIQTDSSYGNPSINLYQIDLNAEKRFGTNTYKTILKGGLSLPFTSQIRGLNINGSLSQKINSKSWMGLSLVKNRNLNAILQDGKIINNGLDLLNAQLGFHWQYFPTKNLAIEMDIFKEFKREYFTFQQYNYSTLLGTIKYNF